MKNGEPQTGANFNLFALPLALSMLLFQATALAQVTGNASARCQVTSPIDCPREGSEKPPPSNLLSVAVVSGGEKQHRELACGFLSGKIPGETSWSNWAPDDWCKLYMNPSPERAGDLH